MVKHQNLCIFVALLTQQNRAAPTNEKRQCGPNKDGILCLKAGGGFSFSYTTNKIVQKCELSAWSAWGTCRQLGNTCQKIQTRIRQCTQSTGSGCCNKLKKEASENRQCGNTYEWSEWSECSQTCGTDAIRTRVGTCGVNRRKDDIQKCADNLDLVQSGKFKPVCVRSGGVGGGGDGGSLCVGGDCGESSDDNGNGISYINQQLTQILTWIQNFQAHEHLHWTSWSSCLYKQTNGQCVATKTRQKTYDDGSTVDGSAEQQIEQCETPFIGWSEWKCAENMNMEVRKLRFKYGIQFESDPCENIIETRTNNGCIKQQTTTTPTTTTTAIVTTPKPILCQIQTWSAWSKCTNGNMTRNRIIMGNCNLGNLSSTETQPCIVETCRLGLWSEWSACSNVLNGSGTRTRNRSATTSCDPSMAFENQYCVPSTLPPTTMRPTWPVTSSNSPVTPFVPINSCKYRQRPTMTLKTGVFVDSKPQNGNCIGSRSGGAFLEHDPSCPGPYSEWSQWSIQMTTMSMTIEKRIRYKQIAIPMVDFQCDNSETETREIPRNNDSTQVCFICKLMTSSGGSVPATNYGSSSSSMGGNTSSYNQQQFQQAPAVGQPVG